MRNLHITIIINWQLPDDLYNYLVHICDRKQITIVISMFAPVFCILTLQAG